MSCHKSGYHKNKIVPLLPQASKEALERLNRITGLRFSRWPESLACQDDEQQRKPGPEAHAAVLSDMQIPQREGEDSGLRLA